MGADHRALRDPELVRRIEIIAQIPAPDVHRLCFEVAQLDAVDLGWIRMTQDFVDDHPWDGRDRIIGTGRTSGPVARPPGRGIIQRRCGTAGIHRDQRESETVGQWIPVRIAEFLDDFAQRALEPDALAGVVECARELTMHGNPGAVAVGKGVAISCQDDDLAGSKDLVGEREGQPGGEANPVGVERRGADVLDLDELEVRRAVGAIRGSGRWMIHDLGDPQGRGRGLDEEGFVERTPNVVVNHPRHNPTASRQGHRPCVER